MAFPTGWSYKRQISIDSGQKSGSPSGIVLTITEDSGLADANGPLDADGTAPAQNGGGDLRVSSDSAGTNQIPLDVVSFVTDNDHASATCELKVNFDDLSSDALYLWWGTTGTESQPSVTDTYGRNAVYDANHALVYSMDEDPSVSSPQLTDRTGNGNDGTSAGSMTSGDVVSGQLGSATDFDGSNDWINCGDIGITAPATVSLWLYPHDVADILCWRLAGQTSGSTSQGGSLGYGGNNSSELSGALLVWDGSAWDRLTDNGTLVANTWQKIDITFASQGNGTVIGYVDNSADANSGTSDFDYSGVNFGLGSKLIGLYGKNPDGLIDDVRIYDRVLTSSDRTTLYNCESNNAAFWAVGSVQSVGGGSSIAPHVMHYKRLMTG